MNIKKGYVLLLMTSMVTIAALATEGSTCSNQSCVEKKEVTKDAVQAGGETVASASTLAQIRELLNEWSTWAWQEGIQEHPYWSAGCGLTAILLVYLLTNKVYRDGTIQELPAIEQTKPKSCCSKKRDDGAITTPETQTILAPETTPNEVLTAKEVCEEHGCDCLVDGKCPCPKDERGSCSCCHKKMRALRECKEERDCWQEEATELFLKKILAAMKEYKAAMRWGQIR